MKTKRMKNKQLKAIKSLDELTQSNTEWLVEAARANERKRIADEIGNCDIYIKDGVGYVHRNQLAAIINKEE